MKLEFTRHHFGTLLILLVNKKEDLGPIYTKRQRQCGVNAAITLVTQFLLTTMELVQNGLQPHSQATPLWLTLRAPQQTLVILNTLPTSSREATHITSSGIQITQILSGSTVQHFLLCLDNRSRVLCFLTMFTLQLLLPSALYQL